MQLWGMIKKKPIVFIENKLAQSCACCTFANNTHQKHKKKSTIHVVCLSCHKYSTVSLNVFLYKGTSTDVYFLFSFGEGGGVHLKYWKCFVP